MIGPTKLCPQGIGLILLDLDGTILVDGTQVRPRVLDAINLARQHGCMVAVASGRAHHMVPEMLRTPEAMDYLVCANGARVYDTISGIIYERLMTREQVLAAMDALEPLGSSFSGHGRHLLRGARAAGFFWYSGWLSSSDFRTGTGAASCA